jgi:hypothetical protein
MKKFFAFFFEKIIAPTFVLKQSARNRAIRNFIWPVTSCIEGGFTLQNNEK